MPGDGRQGTQVIESGYNAVASATSNAGVSTGAAQAARVAAYYDAHTEPFYLRLWDNEDIHFGLFDQAAVELRPALKAMTNAIVAPAAIRPGEFVLDAGCGVGGAALDVARDYGARVLGLTVSQRQVDLARQRAAAVGLAGQAEFARADCSQALPVDDACVDVVLTIEAACHFADKAYFLRECQRVLRPGGRLVGSDWMRVPARIPTGAPHERTLAAVEQSWRLAGLATLDEWCSLLEDTGFTAIVAENFGERVLPNARILSRARLDRMLEMASRRGGSDAGELWLAQYEALCEAWTNALFTVGRFAAHKLGGQSAHCCART